MKLYIYKYYKLFLIAIILIFSLILHYIFYTGKELLSYFDIEEMKYTYITPILNNENVESAYVFKSSIVTVESVLKDIIKENPRYIKSIVEIKDENWEISIGMKTKNEFVYIYKVEETVFIQVSKIDSVNKISKMYHPQYYDSYIEAFKSKDFTNKYNDFIEESLSKEKEKYWEEMYRRKR